MLEWLQFVTTSSAQLQLGQEREVTMRIRDMEIAVNTNRLPQVYLQLVPHFLIGTQAVSLAWPLLPSTDLCNERRRAAHEAEPALARGAKGAGVAGRGASHAALAGLPRCAPRHRPQS
jgi:hypothetical protein